MAPQVHDFTGNHSIISEYIAEIRDEQLQKDPLRFRKNVERLGELLSYEVSKHLNWKSKKVKTPLGTADCKALDQQPVLASILRAGLAMHDGLLNIFDRADNAFISCYRKVKDHSFDIKLEYISCPDITDRTLIIADPMLATGSSMIATLQELFKIGKPEQTHIIVLIASTQGIEYVREHLPNAHIWAAAIDEELDENAYIIPGLGDAGDLAYGEKLQS